MYHIIGVKKVLAKGICIPVIAELTYYSLILIARIPFGRAVNSIAIGLYIVAVLFVTICFQKEKEKLTYKKEND